MKRGTRAEGRRREERPLAFHFTAREVEVALRMLKSIPWLPGNGYDEILSVIKKLEGEK